MHEKVNSGAIHGYTPDAGMAPPAQQMQQYQQVQPVQPPQQYGQQAQQFQPYQAPVYQQQPAYQQPEPVQRKGGGAADFFKRRDVVVLICAIFSMIWLLIVHSAVGDALNANQPGETWEELGAAMGTAIGAAMMIPFFIIAFIGQIFNWVAWLTNRKGFILTAAILYCVSLLFGFANGLGMIPCIVLAFVGYARLKKRQ